MLAGEMARRIALGRAVWAILGLVSLRVLVRVAEAVWRIALSVERVRQSHKLTSIGLLRYRSIVGLLLLVSTLLCLPHHLRHQALRHPRRTTTSGGWPSAQLHHWVGFRRGLQLGSWKHSRTLMGVRLLTELLALASSSPSLGRWP